MNVHLNINSLISFQLCIIFEMEEVEESTRVLGLGVGLFLLILIWFCTIAGLLLFSRLDSPQGLVYVLLASVVTAILLAIPRTDYKVKGKLIISLL